MPGQIRIGWSYWIVLLNWISFFENVSKKFYPVSCITREVLIFSSHLDKSSPWFPQILELTVSPPRATSWLRRRLFNAKNSFWRTALNTTDLVLPGLENVKLKILESGALIMFIFCRLLCISHFDKTQYIETEILRTTGNPYTQAICPLLAR